MATQRVHKYTGMCVLCIALIFLWQSGVYCSSLAGGQEKISGESCTTDQCTVSLCRDGNMVCSPVPCHIASLLYVDLHKEKCFSRCDSVKETTVTTERKNEITVIAMICASFCAGICISFYAPRILIAVQSMLKNREQTTHTLFNKTQTLINDVMKAMERKIHPINRQKVILFDKESGETTNTFIDNYLKQHLDFEQITLQTVTHPKDIEHDFDGPVICLCRITSWRLETEMKAILEGYDVELYERTAFLCLFFKRDIPTIPTRTNCDEKFQRLGLIIDIGLKSNSWTSDTRNTKAMEELEEFLLKERTVKDYNV